MTDLRNMSEFQVPGSRFQENPSERVNSSAWEQGSMGEGEKKNG
jgi:hypothetical protein